MAARRSSACLLTVEIPVPNFTVSDLVQLEHGRIVATPWTVGKTFPCVSTTN